MGNIKCTHLTISTKEGRREELNISIHMTSIQSRIQWTVLKKSLQGHMMPIRTTGFHSFIKKICYMLKKIFKKHLNLGLKKKIHSYFKNILLKNFKITQLGKPGFKDEVMPWKMVAFYLMDGKENKEQSSIPQDNMIIICQVLHSQCLRNTLNTLKAPVHYSINAIVQLWTTGTLTKQIVKHIQSMAIKQLPSPRYHEEKKHSSARSHNLEFPPNWQTPDSRNQR